MDGTLTDRAYRRQVATASIRAGEAVNRLAGRCGDGILLAASGNPDRAVERRPAGGRTVASPWRRRTLYLGMAAAGGLATVWALCLVEVLSAPADAAGYEDATRVMTVFGMLWAVPLSFILAALAGAFETLPPEEAARACVDGSAVGVGRRGLYLGSSVHGVDADLAPSGEQVGWARLVPLEDIGTMVVHDGDLHVHGPAGHRTAVARNLGPAADEVRAALDALRGRKDADAGRPLTPDASSS